MRESLIRVVDPVTGQESQRRCIEVVAAVLARQAQALSVPEFRRAADRLVEHLDPPSPDGAHVRVLTSRRFHRAVVGGRVYHMKGAPEQA